MRVGFIGLGAMGSLMARNLVKAGHDVVGHDVREPARRAIELAGGTAAARVADAVRGAEALILMVVDADQADAVLSDVGGLDGSAVVVACLTQPRDRAKAMAGRLAERGVAMLDAPVSGGTAGAAAGTLTIMSSGPRAAHERVLPLLQAMGRGIYWLGEEHGKGSAAKCINQLLAGVHLAAAAEALSFAERMELPLPLVHEMISKSAGNSWMWGDRGPRMLRDDPPVTSAIEIFVKDMEIVVASGTEAKAVTPLARAASDMFRAAAAQGHGRADDSQVIRVYRSLSMAAGQI